MLAVGIFQERVENILHRVIQKKSHNSRKRVSRSPVCYANYKQIVRDFAAISLHGTKS